MKRRFFLFTSQFSIVTDTFKKYVFIFSLALAIRLTLFFFIHPYGDGGSKKLLISDAVGYHSIAVNIVNGIGYSPHSAYLSMLRTPGYPVFIALWYKIFGIHPWIVILVQILADSLLAVLLMKFALLFWGHREALLAGLLWAVEPLAIIFSNSLLSDSLFVLFIVLSFYFLAKYFYGKNAGHLYLCSALLAAATYIRPVSFYLFLSFMLSLSP